MAFPHPVKQARPRQRGSAALEFALVVIAAVPLLFGTVAMGVTMGRGIQTIQVTRDVAHMYALGVDFSTTGAQNLATTLAQGFNLHSNGDAVLIFSQIVTVYQADCNAAGMGGQCTNIGKTVFAQRIIIGNSSLRTSAFGTPPAQYIGSQGNIAPTDYYRQPTLVATGFGQLLSQGDGDTAWIVEGYFSTPDLSFLNSSNNGGGIYAREIF